MFFAGQLVSFLGDWFTTIALYSAVREVSASGLAVTLVLVSKTLPIFLIAPIAGPLVDRFDRRRLLLTADLGRAVCALLFVLVYRSGSLVGLYVCTIAATLLAGIAIPAKSATLPRIVSAQQYAAANAMGAATWAGTLTLGAALGGLVTAALGIEISFCVDAATFVLSACFFYRLGPQPAPGKSGQKTGFAEVLRYLRCNMSIAMLTLVKAAQTLGGGVFALIPVFGTGVYDGYDGPFWLGMLYAIRGVGTLWGSLWCRVLVADSLASMPLGLVISFVLQGVIYALLGQTSAYWQAALCYMMSGAAQGVVWVFSGTLLQARADAAFHGRVFAAEFGCMTLCMAVSSLGAGWLVDCGFGPLETVSMLAPIPLIGAGLGLYIWRAERIGKLQSIG